VLNFNEQDHEPEPDGSGMKPAPVSLGIYVGP
jgi:hypothetical protein